MIRLSMFINNNKVKYCDKNFHSCGMISGDKKSSSDCLIRYGAKMFLKFRNDDNGRVIPKEDSSDKIPIFDKFSLNH